MRLLDRLRPVTLLAALAFVWVLAAGCLDTTAAPLPAPPPATAGP